LLLGGGAPPLAALDLLPGGGAPPITAVPSPSSRSPEPFFLEVLAVFSPEVIDIFVSSSTTPG
jgi:hypothetical protein